MGSSHSQPSERLREPPQLQPRLGTGPLPDLPRADRVGGRHFHPRPFDVATLDPIPISGFGKHVNGIYDLVFDTANPVVYRNPMPLDTATYDPATRTCADVSYHFQQTAMQFGQPYRWENSWECNVCDRYRRRN